MSGNSVHKAAGLAPNYSFKTICGKVVFASGMTDDWADVTCANCKSRREKL